MIVLITASLSSKILERSVRQREHDLHVTIDQHLGFPLFEFGCVSQTVTCLVSVSRCCGMLVIWFCLLIAILQSPHPINREPSSRSPSSNEMISDSVELWDTDVCFLYIQLMVTNVRLPKIQKIPPDVDSESSKSPTKSESWNKPNRQC